jgi:hypothetical protein
LKTGTKLLLAAGAVVIGYKGVGFFRKAANIKNNIYVSPLPTNFKIVSPLLASVGIKVDINNVSGINLSIKNLLSKLILNLTDGTQLEAGVSNLTPNLNLVNNQTQSFNTNFNIPYLTLVGKIVTGKVKSIDLITYYDFKGQTLNVKSNISVADFVKKAKSALGFSGVGGVKLL